MDLCGKNQAWCTGWSRLRARGDVDFRDAVTEAAALHSRDELFSKHIEPEPAPEDPEECPMVEASDDEDDAPMPDAPEPELIDMPPALASALPMSYMERCSALRLVYGRVNASKKCHLHHISASLSLLSHVSVVRVSWPVFNPCFHVLTTSPRHLDSDKPLFLR